MDREPVRVLKIEACSPPFEARLKDPDRFLAKLLISDPGMKIEPIRVLNSVSCLVTLADRPTSAVRALPTPLV